MLILKDELTVFNRNIIGILQEMSTVKVSGMTVINGNEV